MFWEPYGNKSKVSQSSGNTGIVALLFLENYLRNLAKINPLFPS
ncbi:hypothetical protein HMPREF0623_0113 [Pediococcus acidilactici DSM 20284]|uniref:Uncharacterized protein n=1 Tax=Pediococcus acidilactici DSM 20284 TaxID=862514 RepID=E0NEQ1_PEDAC|nr:hypothetical protein HMPREF0623_0113 [Pediococcus acidilactici DSM 20284]